MNLAQGVREGMDRGHGQSKVTCCSGPAWPSGTQKGQLLVWFILSEARSHHQESLFCTGSAFGQHTAYPHMKPRPGALCAVSRQNEPACSKSLE